MGELLIELRSRIREIPCPDHGSRTVYDFGFDSLRCCWCGHRVMTHGVAPAETMKMPPWRWPAELSGRKWAKSTRAGYARLSSQ